MTMSSDSSDHIYWSSSTRGTTGTITSVDYTPYSQWPTTWTSTSTARCAYCDGYGHPSKPVACPRVKSVSYYKNGGISKIEFHPPS